MNQKQFMCISFSKCWNSHQKGLGKIHYTSFNTLLVYIHFLYICFIFSHTYPWKTLFPAQSSPLVFIFLIPWIMGRENYGIYTFEGASMLVKLHWTSNCHFWGMLRGEGDPPPVKGQRCARLALPLEIFISSFTCRMTGVRVPVWFTEAM